MRRLARGAGSCWIVLDEISLSDHGDRHPQTELPQLSTALPVRLRLHLHLLATSHPELLVCMRASLVGTRPAAQLNLFPFQSQNLSLGTLDSPDRMFGWHLPHPCKHQAPHSSLAAALLRQCADVPRAAGQWVPAFRNRHRERHQAKTGKPAQLGRRPLRSSWTWILSSLGGGCETEKETPHIVQ